MKTILIAAAEITARFPAEKGGLDVDQKIDAGTPLTPALIKQFSLTEDDVTRLKARGHIVEQSAHVVGAGDGPSAADLAAAEKRAADAEAKVAALTTDLEGATRDQDKLSSDLLAARKLLTADQLKTLDAPAKA